MRLTNLKLVPSADPSWSFTMVMAGMLPLARCTRRMPEAQADAHRRRRCLRRTSIVTVRCQCWALRWHKQRAGRGLLRLGVQALSPRSDCSSGPPSASGGPPGGRAAARPPPVRPAGCSAGNLRPATGLRLRFEVWSCSSFAVIMMVPWPLGWQLIRSFLQPPYKQPACLPLRCRPMQPPIAPKAQCR